MSVGLINNIFNEDCVSGMKSMHKSNMIVDLIIADPPYVISVDSQFHTMKDRKNSRTGTNFGSWDQEFSNELWIKNATKLLKKGGSILIFNDLKKATEIIEIAEKCGLVYKDTLIWNKTNPMPRNRDRRYVQDIELIQWFVKPKGKWIFNRESDKYDSCVRRYPSESGGGFKRYHPTQKPIKLISDLILRHSNPEDLVLDPFSGSGSTAVSCKKLNRNFIGFELSEEYYKKSIGRLNEN